MTVIALALLIVAVILWGIACVRPEFGRISLIAAGLVFYGLSQLLPALAAAG